MDEAERIAHRLIARAIPHGHGCTWDVLQLSPRKSTEIVYVRAGSSLYQGASGIALFLAEFWGVTGDGSALKCAFDALRYCEQFGSGPKRYGLYSGGLGVALTAARLAELTQDDEWREVAVRCLTGLSELACTDTIYDVIGGAAGAILGLLRIQHALEMPELCDLAVRFGERLEQAARRTPIGWSWGSSFGVTKQDLTGYAHGASGIAHAFLELYAVTGDGRWRFAAKRAIAYERHHRAQNGGDWPDFRESELNEAKTADELTALRLKYAARRATQVEPPKYARGWCHGAPGIALARLRALSLDVDSEEVRPELYGALRSTGETLSHAERSGHCLCHGQFGNADVLLLAREHVGVSDTGLVAATVERALALLDVGGRWEAGFVNGVYDPSLLVGEAGIGHFLLRAVVPMIPSVLCVSDWAQPSGPVHSLDTEFRALELQRLLPCVTSAWSRLGHLDGIRQRVAAVVSSTTDIADAVRGVMGAIAAEPSPFGDFARDALLVDAAMLDERQNFTDFTEQFFLESFRPAPDTIDWSTAHVRLAPHARIVRTMRAWVAWRDSDYALPEPPDEEEHIVVYRWGQSEQQRALTALQSVIIDALQAPALVEELVAAVMSSVEPDSEVGSEMPSFVRMVVSEAIGIGFVVVC